jgi:hypothetical protein
MKFICFDEAQAWDVFGTLKEAKDFASTMLDSGGNLSHPICIAAVIEQSHERSLGDDGAVDYVMAGSTEASDKLGIEMFANRSMPSDETIAEAIVETAFHWLRNRQSGFDAAASSDLDYLENIIKRLRTE